MLITMASKADIIQSVAEKTEVSKKSVKAILDATLESIQSRLVEGEEVSFIGFGRFSVADRETRNGRNPQTGEPIEIPAHKAPVFRAGKSLKQAVNHK